PGAEAHPRPGHGPCPHQGTARQGLGDELRSPARRGGRSLRCLCRDRGFRRRRARVLREAPAALRVSTGPRSLADRTVFITGASRGIGRAIALRAAADGARLVIAAKSDAPHPRLAGTIHDTAAAVRGAGGEALAVRMDVRDEAQVESAVAAAVEAFGGIDVLINNAGAISLTSTLDTPVKRFDLMFDVNLRGAWLC